MYNKQLNTFLEVARAGNFSKAAAELYVSSSAVIQQINHLEEDLGVRLFERGRYGVRLTEAGAYLAREARDYIQKGTQIRKDLLDIATKKSTVCVGTNSHLKVRLLYDIWAQFSGRGEKLDIRLVNLPEPYLPGPEVELVESVQNGAVWLADWEFMKLCDARLGCAVVPRQFGAEEGTATFAALKNWTVYCMDYPGYPGIAADTALCGELVSEGIRVLETENYDFNLVWKCASERAGLIAPLCWRDIMADMVILPFEKDYRVPYGLYYRKEHSLAVDNLLDFITNEYTGPAEPLAEAEKKLRV